MMRRSFLLTPALLLSLLSLLAHAAPEATPQDVLSNVKDGDARSTFAGFDSRIAVEAGDADAKVSLRVTDTVPLGNHRYFRWGVKAQAPFDKDKQDEVDIGTLSGLSSGTSASLDASWMLWPGVPPSAQELRTEYCDVELPKVVPGFKWQDSDRPELSLSLSTPLGCHVSLFTAESIEAMVKKLNAAVEKYNAPIKKRNEVAAAACLPPKTCPAPEPLADPAEPVENLKARLKSLDRSRLADNASTIRLITLGVSANQKDFSYVLGTAPTEVLKSDKTGSGASIGYTEVHGRWLWSVGYSRERSYKGADKLNVCSPIGTTGSASCKEAAVGAPTFSDTDIAFAEARWTIAPAKLALSPRIEYDADESAWAVRIPIYLATNAKDELTGGIVLGYTTGDEDDLGIAVFVGKAFSFFD